MPGYKGPDGSPDTIDRPDIAHPPSGNKIGLKSTGTGSYVMDVNMIGGGNTWITVDSGAEDSVCPENWGAHFGIRKIDASKKIPFRSASGNALEHHGERTIKVVSPF